MWLYKLRNSGTGIGSWDGSEIRPSVPLFTGRFKRTMTLMMAEGTSRPSAATRTHGATSAREATGSQRLSSGAASRDDEREPL
jgi:hypothetical protein